MSIIKVPQIGQNVYTISKTTPWKRMTKLECETMDAALAETDAQLRNIYFAANYISTGDENYPQIRSAFVGAFGAQRAAEILAPEI